VAGLGAGDRGYKIQNFRAGRGRQGEIPLPQLRDRDDRPGAGEARENSRRVPCYHFVILPGENRHRIFSAGCDIPMSLSTCPIATVEAPAERVWQLLADPCNYGLWWDEETRRVAWRFSIEPAGPARPGQRISALTRALGKDWAVRITVKSIDQEKRVLDLTTQLPFGITVRNHIACRPLDNQHCRVSFG
jgi:Polyketide cyclase / dehydrase and lipid transport